MLALRWHLFLHCRWNAIKTAASPRLSGFPSWSTQLPSTQPQWPPAPVVILSSSSAPAPKTTYRPLEHLTQPGWSSLIAKTRTGRESRRTDELLVVPTTTVRYGSTGRAASSEVRSSILAWGSDLLLAGGSQKGIPSDGPHALDRPSIPRVSKTSFVAAQSPSNKVPDT